jgi:antitoxin MazE
MQARVRKWGNSLALRLPKAIAEEAGVAENDTVDLGVVNGRIVVVPRARFRLEDLLREITRSNRHTEVSTGTRRGREQW